MFKKSISCLLAALMIIASMPFSAISASAADNNNTTIGLSVDNSGNKMYGVLTNNSGDPDNRFKTVSGSTTKYAILCNDAQNDNFDIAYMNFDVSSFDASSLLDSGAEVKSANLTVNISVESFTEDCGLRICYPTKNNNEFYQYGQKKLSSHTVWSKNDGGHISRANTYYGLTDITSYDTVAQVTGNLTVDIAGAINWAINNNKETATVCFLLKKAGQTGGTGPDSTHVWSDTNLKFTNDTVKANITYKYLPLDKFVRKTANNYGTFEQDSDDNTEENYRKAYINCLYAPSKMSPTYTYGQYDVTGLNGAVSENKMYAKAHFYYGNSVMLYDGVTPPQIGIGFAVVGYSVPTLWSYGSLNAYRCNLNGVSDMKLVNDRWRGYDGRMNYTYIMFNSGQGDKIGTTNNYTCNQGKNGYYGNYLQYKGGDFTAGYKSVQLNFTFRTGHDNLANDQTTGTISSANIFIVNYKKVIDKVNEARSNYKKLDKANCDIASLDNYAKAINELQKFDPNSYDYASSPGSAAQKAGNKIDELVQAVDDAYKNIKYNYTFKSASDPAVETVVVAKNASDAYANKPANTVSNSKPLNEKQHTTYTYTWPTSPSGYVFTEQKEEVTENHDFRTLDTCTCGAKVDLTSFDAANQHAVNTHLTGNTTYEVSSVESYYAVYEQMKTKRTNGELLCQADFDNATFEILYAKTKLKKLTGTVTLTVYDQNNKVITGAGKSYKDKDYGTEITIAPETEQNIYKYVIEKDGTTSEIYGQPSISYVVTGDATVKAYCNKAQSVDEKYTKVTFLVGGKISDIKYVKADETLDTSTANKLQFPFFTTGKWDKESVKGSADISSVTVRAELTPVDSDKCGVHIPGKDGLFVAHQMKYNTKVDLKDYGFDDSVDYALSKSQSKDDIIAYMHGTVFYVPARKDVYVLKVAKGDSTKDTKINTVGVFTSVDDNYKYVGFNCKFSLAEGCTPVEWGITFIPILPSGRPDSSQVFRVKALSAENEYTATLSLTKTNKKYSAIRAKAYLKYRDKGGNIQVKEGDEHIQAFATENKFGITDINQNQN